MKEKIAALIKDFIINDEKNWFNEINAPFFDEPLIQVAAAANPIFSEYKNLIGQEHLTPKEAYERQFGADTFKAGSVISVVLPLNEKIRESNRSQTEWPSKEWTLNRTFGDTIFVNHAALSIEKLIAGFGANAVAPALASWFKVFRAPDGPRSIWSERHIAYAAGLGSFSLNDAFITEKGIAVRLISFVTDLTLAADEKKDGHYAANCLFFSKNICGACIKRCPVNAITEKGHDKIGCYKRTYGEESQKIALTLGADPKAASGCGLCQTKVPCEYKNPVASL